MRPLGVFTRSTGVRSRSFFRKNRIRFFLKKDLERTPVDLVKTPSGRIRVSTPEATALDLVRYHDRAGHLNHVATVLAELAEKIDAQKLVQAAEADGELAAAQRLGYLLELVGAAKVASRLAKWLDGHSPRPVLLRPGIEGKEIPRNARWRVIVNHKVEPDDVWSKGTSSLHGDSKHLGRRTHRWSKTSSCRAPSWKSFVIHY